MKSFGKKNLLLQAIFKFCTTKCLFKEKIVSSKSEKYFNAEKLNSIFADDSNFENKENDNLSDPIVITFKSNTWKFNLQNH